MKPNESHPPFFVMAHHRSGSNFLNDLLQQHSGIECLNEPLSMHTRFFREHDLALWTAADFDTVLLHGSLDLADMVWVSRIFFRDHDNIGQAYRQRLPRQRAAS